MTGGQRGENHGHRNDPAVECVGTGKGVVRRVQQEGEQSCHVHGGHTDGVDHVVEPLTGGGGRAGHASNLAVSGVQAVTESEKQCNADAHTNAGRAGNQNDEACSGTCSGNRGDAVGGDAQRNSCRSEVACYSAVDPAGVGGNADAGLLRCLKGAQGVGKLRRKSRCGCGVRGVRCLRGGHAHSFLIGERSEGE